MSVQLEEQMKEREGKVGKGEEQEEEEGKKRQQEGGNTN